MTPQEMEYKQLSARVSYYRQSLAKRESGESRPMRHDALTPAQLREKITECENRMKTIRASEIT